MKWTPVRRLMLAMTLTLAAGCMGPAATKVSVQDTNKARATGFYDQVMSQGDLEAVSRFVSDSWFSHTPIVPDGERGIEGARAAATFLRTGFPDLRVRVERMIAEQDFVTIQVTYTGTHSGDFMGAAPTGRTITFSGIDVFRFEDGKAVEHWGLLDTNALMRQLGVMAIPTPRPREALNP